MAAEMVIRLVDGSESGLSPANDIPQPNEVPTVGSVRPKLPDPVPPLPTQGNSEKESVATTDGDRTHSDSSVFIESMEEFTRRLETAILSLSKPVRTPKAESQRPVAEDSPKASSNDGSVLLAETIGSVRKYMPKWLDALLADVQKSIPTSSPRHETIRPATTVAEVGQSVAVGSFELERLTAETNRLLGLIAVRVGDSTGDSQDRIASDSPEGTTSDGTIGQSAEGANDERRRIEVPGRSQEGAFPSIAKDSQSLSSSTRDGTQSLPSQSAPSETIPSVQPTTTVARTPQLGESTSWPSAGSESNVSRREQTQHISTPSVQAQPFVPSVSENGLKTAEQTQVDPGQKSSVPSTTPTAPSPAVKSAPQPVSSVDSSKSKSTGSSPSFTSQLANRVVNRIRGSRIARSRTVQRIARGAKSLASRSSKAILSTRVGKSIASSSIGRAIGAKVAGVGARLAGTAAIGTSATAASSAAGAAGTASASGAVAAGAGVAAVAAPIAITVAAFASVAIAAKALKDSFEGVADSLEKYSADISLARSRRQSNTEINLVERAKVLGPKLAPLENANTRLQDASERLWTRILEAVSPLATGLAKLIDITTVGVESVNVGFASAKVAINTLDDLTDQDLTDDRADQVALAKAAGDLVIAIDRLNGVDRANGNDTLDAEFQKFLALGGK